MTASSKKEKTRKRSGAEPQLSLVTTKHPIRTAREEVSAHTGCTANALGDAYGGATKETDTRDRKRRKRGFSRGPAITRLERRRFSQ